MNVYLFELKLQIKSFLIWTIAIISIVFLFMVGIYPIFFGSMDEVQVMLNNFPEAFKAAFGVGLTDFFSYSGFFSFTFSYIALAGAIMASAHAIMTFAREKRLLCTEFIFTKPKSRESIFTAKLLSSLTVLAATNVLFIISVIVCYFMSSQRNMEISELILASSGLFFTQLVFLSLGMFFAVFAKKIRSISGIATAIGFTGFILSALEGILEEEKIRFVAPLKYFEPTKVFSDGKFELKYVLTACVVVAICVGASYIRYCKRDVISK